MLHLTFILIQSLSTIFFFLQMNIFLKKADISWNGLGLEGAKALKEMLINNNVLEEINISNNRIDTEASVEIGRGY